MMLKDRIRLVFLLSLLLFLGVNFNTQSENGNHPLNIVSTLDNKTIVYATPYEFFAYSYYANLERTDGQWQSATSASLVKRSNIDPGLWTNDLTVGLPNRSSDNLTYTFTLRDNLFFSSGNELNATDVEFSLKVALTPAINQDFYDQYLGVFDNNSLIVINYTTFTLTFLQPVFFPFQFFTFPIIDSDLFLTRYDECLVGLQTSCDWNDSSGRDMVSAGPFKVSSIVPSTQINLTANPFYYAADQVWVNQLVFKRVANIQTAVNGLLDGSIDILDQEYLLNTDKFAGSPQVTSRIQPGFSSQELALNHLHPYYGTGENIPGNTGPDYNDALLVRKAMSHIVDRQYTSDTILKGLGTPSTSAVSPIYPGYDNSIIPRNYSIQAARNYMTQAGFDYSTLGPENSDGSFNNYFFDITVMSPDTDPDRNQWASRYVLELKKIGIGVTNYVSTRWSEIIPRSFGWSSPSEVPIYDNGGYDVLFLRLPWSQNFNPLETYGASGSCVTGSCWNFYNFDLHENMTNVASTINSYLSEVDVASQINMLKDVQRVLYDNIPMIPIIHEQEHWAYASNLENLNTRTLAVFEFDWIQLMRVNRIDAVTSSNSTINSNSTPTSSSSLTNTSEDDAFVPLPNLYVYLGLSVLVLVVRRKRL